MVTILLTTLANIIILLLILFANGHRYQVLLSVDQLINARFGGSHDELISARCWRERIRAKYHRWRVIIDWISLRLLKEANHCEKSYNKELRREYLPKAYRE